VIGWLNSNSPGPSAPFVDAFHRGLSEAGYVVGQNAAIEYGWAEGRHDRLPALAADLVGRRVDVIVAGGGVAALAAKNATSTIPIVFATGGDPVESGLVASLARPGGNLTGVGMMFTELMPKLLELLSELVPQARVIALLVNPKNSLAEGMIRDVQKAAKRERGAAPYPEGRHRKRDRRRFRDPCPNASQRARRRHRCSLRHPARTARGPGITPWRPDDLLAA
jgi:putative tryptophan/tyrosine transport system substrate-binding protein